MAAVKKQTDQSLRWLQVAHDLRSPLTALEILSARLVAISSEERALIQQTITRIQEIALDVLSPAQALQSRDPWAPDLLHSLLLQKQIEYPQVRFLLEVSVGHPVHSKVPSRLLNRVLSNLLNNAAEANGNVGEVYVKVRYAVDGYQIEIEDQGAGIPAELWPELGELGISGKKDTHVQRGLGLHSAFEVIRQLGGRLCIADRQSGRGTIVRVNV